MLPRRQAPPFDITNTDALLTRIRAHDEAAFETIYLAVHDRLWQFAAAQLGEDSVAEDMVQDVLIAFWNNRTRWELHDHPALLAYLYKAVRNLIERHRRHARVVARGESIVATDTSPPGMGEVPLTPDAQVELSDIDAAITAAIAAMPERRRLTATLRLIDGLSYAQIADILDVSQAAVITQISRIRDTLDDIAKRYR